MKQRAPAVLLPIAAALVFTSVAVGIGWKRAEGMTPSTQSPTQAQPVPDDVVFYPVGNQAVRKLVFIDRKTGTIYEYDSGGKLDNTWVLTKLGDRLEKK